MNVLLIAVARKKEIECRIRRGFLWNPIRTHSALQYTWKQQNYRKNRNNLWLSKEYFKFYRR